ISVVVSKDKKDETYTFTLGKETADKGGVYLKTDRNDLVYVVSNSILATLQRELLDTVVLNFDPAKVKSVKLTGWKNVTGVPTAVEFVRNDKREWVSKAAGFDADPAKVQALVGDTLAHLRAKKFVSYKGGPAKGQGLDVKKDPQASPLTVEVTLEGDKKPETVTLTVGGTDAKEKAYYATASTLPGAVFLVPDTDFQKVLEKPAYFLKGT
ncbi:MAG TPA: DUF4340 domain-containing protein, partial [Gemmataceae bacterium]|nr:DUF4340 domain-containing protein [Gemmataceae bacterium]